MTTAPAPQQKNLLSDRVATFCVETAEEMGTLGKLFGGQFVRPSVYCAENSEPVVASLYAASGSGKTSFAKAALDCFKVQGKPLFDKLSKFNPSRRSVDGLSFVYNDFGYSSYSVLSGSLYMDEYGKDYLFEPTTISPPSFKGVYIFEHSTVPHLEKSGAVVLISDIGYPCCTRPYLENMDYMVNNFLPQNPWNNLLSRRINNLLDMQEPRHLGSERRIVDIILTSNNEVFGENFRKFKSKAAKLAL
ncbi:MAG: hypothetical protein PHX43_07740 [Alphaproteobacteria bacterium]|nr:hypothetical protein [Alphaproteobacteria bacterium]